MGIGGVILRFCSLAIRVLQFLASAVILGIFSYYLAILSRHDQHIATWLKAVEGLAGASALYGLLGILFVCCLGGKSFFAFLGVLFDVLFTGAMVAIAVLTRNGIDQCSGTVNTPIGEGNASDDSKADLSFGMACKLEKVTFALPIPDLHPLPGPACPSPQAREALRSSPANGYTSGSRRRWWRRNRSPDAVGADNALPGHPTPGEVEMGAEPKNENNWFGSWGRKKENNTVPLANGGGAAQNTYGYGNSAYTGNI
ncbi:hypothetical protein N7509_011333 [Penicillium cosmopolitanum]|uniref:MARVEL domain-containing protein n=1 Tax=Penicillium cosmopolitanum TaxID=1131564 RepID=A0A9X0B5I9_9EURO|nr:uncharacterized protein N7509_011333 [Penicillium cosmopolitanum]KAJ5388792.1 hypothetical protein N7509_011333 [Penicillium cosmopolitanum]